MNAAAQTIISDIRQKLEKLELLLRSDVDAEHTPSVPPSGKPKKIYQMFPSNDSSDLNDMADAAMEKPADDNEEYDELDVNSLDEIDDDLEDEDSGDEDEDEDKQ